MIEDILNFGENGSLTGIVTYDNNPQKRINICAVFLNAGLIHKIGPNKIFVKIARELAMEGISCFRFDYSGIGDSELTKSDRNFNELKLLEIKQAINIVQQEIGISKFIVIGLCTGAKDAFSVALTEERIVGLSLIDGVYMEEQSLIDIYPIATRNCAIRYYKKNLFSLKRWLKIITGKSNVLSAKNIIVAFNMVSRFLLQLVKYNKNKNLEAKPNKIELDFSYWNKFFEKKIKVHLIFCEGSSAIDVFNHTLAKELKKEPFSELITIKTIKDVDHTFTPIWSQELLTRVIKGWIKENYN